MGAIAAAGRDGSRVSLQLGMFDFRRCSGRLRIGCTPINAVRRSVKGHGRPARGAATARRYLQSGISPRGIAALLRETDTVRRRNAYLGSRTETAMRSSQVSSITVPLPMQRSDTRALVEEVGKKRDPIAALALYDHSIQCGHGRIALLRYLDAKDLAAPLTRRHHAYAQAIALSLSVSDMESIAKQAMERSRQRRSAKAKKELCM